MVTHGSPAKASVAKKTGQLDGRRKGSLSSRKKIVAAMMKLVAAGDVSPSAARVAEAASVGERTVFRHFDDLDLLFQEMAEEIEVKVMPALLKPYESSNWRDQLLELSERRASLYEAIMPYRISADAKRFRSPFLMQDYRRFQRVERDSVEAILPPNVQADMARARGIMVALSFYSWRLLRQDEDLGIRDTKAVIQQMVSDIMAQIRT